uniref:Uncharacterized protein n=1 Tax=Cajanus cajan TaxID=3821 RepID=A0A151TGF6_CAJCA|nr:hypothetical protein KK1_012402 [Cajanus cajan]
MSNHRVSFELSSQQVLKSLENKPAASAWTKVLSKLKDDAATADKEENSVETELHEKDQSLTLSSAKEFNFDNADGRDNIVADWWANEKVAGKEGGASKDWSFFPMIQPGLS